MSGPKYTDKIIQTQLTYTDTCIAHIHRQTQSHTGTETDIGINPYDNLHIGTDSDNRQRMRDIGSKKERI